MSVTTMTDQLVTIIEATPVANGPAFRHDVTATAVGARRFSVELVGGAHVVPKNEARKIKDVRVQWHYDAQTSAAPDRWKRVQEIAVDVDAVCSRLLDETTWNRPSSGIHRVTTTGREAMAHQIDQDDNGNDVVRVDFVVEYT